MRVEFDRRANAAYIYLKDVGEGEAVEQYVVESASARGQIILDLDKNGRLIGIEILNATRALPQELLDAAQRI